MSAQLPKILLVDNARYQTGALTSIVGFATALRAEYEFIFVLPSGSEAVASITATGFKVYTLPFLEISRSAAIINYLPRLLRNTSRLLRIINREKIDLLHVNDLYNMVGCMVKMRRPSFPVVYHARLLSTSYIGPLYKYFARMLRRYADKILCVSAAVARDIGPAPQSIIVYDAIRLREKLPAWNGLEQPAHAHILYLANYVQGKGQQFAVQAMQKVLAAYPGAHLYFAGGTHSEADKQFRQSLETLSRELGVINNVQFEGHVSDVEARIKQADIVLNLSESESFSMVSLETMVYGVPLVVSDCGGPAEVTGNGQYGSLVPNRSASDAAQAIIGILDQPALALERGRQGIAFVHKMFDVSQGREQLGDVYRRLLATGSTANE